LEQTIPRSGAAVGSHSADSSITRDRAASASETRAASTLRKLAGANRASTARRSRSDPSPWRPALASCPAASRRRCWSASTGPYDLVALAANRQPIAVEVKGTTGALRSVLLTRNEVEHAKTAFPNVALFVLAGVELVKSGDDGPTAQGGVAHAFLPWNVSECALSPLAFECVLNPETPSVRWVPEPFESREVPGVGRILSNVTTPKTR